MVEAHPWVQKFHEQLEYAVAQGPDHYISRSLEKIDLTEPKLERALFSAYELGRAYQDSSVQENAAKILAARIPDLEKRLPFYEVMFDIMDKGELKQGERMTRYGLSEQLRVQLCAKLEGKMEHTQWAVGRLSRELVHFPGKQFNVVHRTLEERHERVAIIANYLHQPMREVLTVEESRSSAAVHYEYLMFRK